MMKKTRPAAVRGPNRDRRCGGACICGDRIRGDPARSTQPTTSVRPANGYRYDGYSACLTGTGRRRSTATSTSEGRRVPERISDARVRWCWHVFLCGACRPADSRTRTTVAPQIAHGRRAGQCRRRARVRRGRTASSRSTPGRSAARRPTLSDQRTTGCRLLPYSDTPNPGGVYILAVCKIRAGSNCFVASFRPSIRATASTTRSRFRQVTVRPRRRPARAGIDRHEGRSRRFNTTYKWGMAKSADKPQERDQRDSSSSTTP